MRSSYYSYYTGRNWYDMENYDLAINLATIEAEEAAQLILDYMEKKKINSKLIDNITRKC